MIGKVVSHYKILEKLGEGGMGVVYKAQDLKLDRPVALKFLPPDLTRDPEAKQRFVHEAKAASVLQHNNICTVHDIDEIPDGQMFIVMDLYKGETLKEKIGQGLLRIEEAIDIAIQVAQGLAKAHEHSIVHRDIKPANIMVTSDGVAKIVDFGLAKLGGRSMLTRSGSTLGTAAYMSPEQARGEEVDQRTDIWSLGVVLYEMVTGRLPFRGEHEAALLYSIVHEGLVPIATYRADVPVPLVSVISKALQKDRTQRLQTAREFVDDLMKIATSAVEVPKQEKSILVLPFENLSPDPDQEYFSDGLTEEVISDLSGIKSLRVISRNSAMTFKGTKKRTPDIARELDVRYVLEGSVRKSGNALRIMAQLIDAERDTHLWAEKYTGTLDDVFDLQESLSRRIAEALRVTLTPKESEHLAARPLVDKQAHDVWLRARQLALTLTPGGLGRARALVEEALRTYGESALLHATMGWIDFVAYDDTDEGAEEVLRHGEEHAARALALDPGLAWSHFATAGCRHRRCDIQGFVQSAKRALEIERDSHTLAVLSLYLADAGKIEAARHYANEAARIDPLTFLTTHVVGYVDLLDGGGERAFLKLHRSCDRFARGEPWSTFIVGFAAVQAGREEEARQLFACVAEGSQPTFTPLSQLFFAALKGDEPGVAEPLRNSTFSRLARRAAETSYFVATCFARVGNHESALDWLGNAIKCGYTNHRFMMDHDQLLRSLRDHPAFIRLMERARQLEQALEV